MTNEVRSNTGPAASDATPAGPAASDATPAVPAGPIPRDPDGLISVGAWNREFDKLYRKSDQLYHNLARGCGLSDSAYWLLYAIYARGNEASLRDLCEAYCLSKQTLNSTLRTLESKGYVETSFCEGSRKAKRVAFTPAGRAFVAAKIVPASQAERRAFEALAPEEQDEMMRLIDKYVGAVEEEIKRMEGEEAR